MRVGIRSNSHSYQDYALWDVIENGNSWVPIPVSATETGPSTGLKMTMPSTAEEKICKKNDVKARSLLLMALPNEHQLTFDQYVDAQSMFVAIKARFGGNEATKKTQKALLKQQYENFNASSSESLDSIFNRLQKLVSRLAILGVVTPPEDLNVKFLRSLPSEWDTHVVVWMNKPDFDTMGFMMILYNNFKIVEQKVKRSAGAINDDKNLAFLTASGASSTNNINTVNPEVSTGTTKVNTASTKISTASFSDATVYAFLSTQPQGSQLVHEDLEQLHDDDLEEMDLKWNMALLSMRARKFYQRTGRKIIIDGSSTAGYDKSKVECFNCHKMGHFARECRAPRSKNNKNWNQGSSSKAVRIEDASEKAMCAIDGAGFDWSDMAEEEIQANMALMAFSDSEEIALLKRSVGHKEYLMGLLRTELEKVKEEKEGFEFKISKFEKSAKDLDQLLASQITDKSKKGFGYNVVPSPHPLILNRPTPLDLSYSGLEEFKQPEVNEYGPRDSSLKPTTGCDKEEEEPKKARENNDAPIIEDWVSDDEDEVEPIPKVEKKLLYLLLLRKSLLNLKNHLEVISCPKTSHPSAYKYMAPKAVLMKTGLKSVNTARPVNTVRSVNTGRPFSTARQRFNTGRQNVNTVRASGFNAVKPTGMSNSQLNDKGFVDSGCSRHMTGNIAHLLDFKDLWSYLKGSKTLIEAARTMLADSKLPTTFWAEAVSTACYLKIPLNPFEDFMYYSHTLDNLGKFDGKSDEENKPMIEGNGPKWLFDLNSLTQSMNYVPVVAGTFSNDFAADAQLQAQNGTHDDCSLQNNGTADQQVNTASPEVNTGSIEVSIAVPEVNTATLEDTQVEDQEIELGNISPSYEVSSTPH
ncbi:ribonuclease H-like domain-containing protein, partial [Tanacetum coccineum]